MEQNRKSANLKLIIAGILVVIAVAFVAIGIYRDSWREANKNSFEFATTLDVQNLSNVEYLDTLTMIVLDKILDRDSLQIFIVNSPLSFDSEEYIIIGYVDKDRWTPHKYWIFVSKNHQDANWIQFVSHEMIHIDQMESGRLVSLYDYPGKVFDGDTINFKKVPYQRRPFEIDAVNRSIQIKRDLTNLLYKKFIW